MPDDQIPKPDPVLDAMQDALKAADESLDAAVAPADIQTAIQVQLCVQAKIAAYNEAPVSSDNVDLQAGAVDTQHAIDQLTDLKTEVARIASGFAVAGKVVDVLDEAISVIGA